MQINIKLPTLHSDQVAAWRMPGRFKAIRCGRRWGKSLLGEEIAICGAVNRQSIGWFAPDYKTISEVFAETVEMIDPAKASSSKNDGLIRTVTGGRIDFWSLENERAGRSRKYHKVIIDEGAFTKPIVMMDIWNKSIKPTLLDYGGTAYVLSNTNGQDPDNFFWRICNEKEHGFVEYHAPSHKNPFLPKAELDKLPFENHPLVYAQEYLAEFVDWAGVAFFERDKMLIPQADGSMGPISNIPDRIDVVYAIVDTAVKAGKENDGTAVIYFGKSSTGGIPLAILDWDIVQIEGATLETWLPGVFANLELLAKQCRARIGSVGAFIEDKNSGTILLQQAAKNNWPGTAIDSKLTAMGKDERAIAASPHVYQGKVKFTAHAFNKVVTYKMATRNHCLSQVLSFRVGDKDHAKRADDLLDCFTYGVVLGLGDSSGMQ